MADGQNEGWVGREFSNGHGVLRQIRQDLAVIESAVTATQGLSQDDHDLVQKIYALQLKQQAALASLVDNIITILSYLTPNPVGFNVAETTLPSQTESQLKGETMSPQKLRAGVDLTVLDDGKGVLFTLTPVNSQGATVPLPAGSGPVAGASSDPAMTVAQDPGDPAATPPRPADTTGLVFLGSIVQPPKDVAGIVVTFTDTLTNGTVISTKAARVDIVPDPNNPNNPSGFTVAESAA